MVEVLDYKGEGRMPRTETISPAVRAAKKIRGKRTQVSRFMSLTTNNLSRIPESLPWVRIKEAKASSTPPAATASPSASVGTEKPAQRASSVAPGQAPKHSTARAKPQNKKMYGRTQGPSIYVIENTNLTPSRPWVRASL